MKLEEIATRYRSVFKKQPSLVDLSDICWILDIEPQFEVVPLNKPAETKELEEPATDA